MANQRGSVTAEFAVVLPALTALLAVLLLAVAAGMLQVRLEEGAQAGARALARGESHAQVVATVTRLAGPETAVALADSGDFVTVSVNGRVKGVLAYLVPWTQTARATARREAATSSGAFAARGVSAPNGGGRFRFAPWRWARAPWCPLPSGKCAATAVGPLPGSGDTQVQDVGWVA